MAFRFILLSALAVVSASALHLPLSYQSHAPALSYQSHNSAPLAIHNIDGHHEEDYHHDSHPHYQFSYDVHDTHTGDIKSQQESRDGDRVEGEYSLIEPDGTRRIVKYTADKHTGFQAIVQREPAHHQPLVSYQKPALISYQKPALISYQKPALISYQKPALIPYQQPLGLQSHSQYY